MKWFIPTSSTSRPPLAIKPLEPFLGPGNGKLYFRIIGPSGSGKGVFGRFLLENDPEAFTFTGTTDPRKVLGTVFPTLGWVTVGRYTLSCGGADSVKYRELITEALYRCCTTRFHVLIEGLTVSGASERFWEIDLGAQKSGRRALLCYLDYPVEECIRRIYLRNGGKPFKEESMKERHQWILNAVLRYEGRIAEGAPVLLYRESSPGIEGMLSSMLAKLREVSGSEPLLSA